MLELKFRRVGRKVYTRVGIRAFITETRQIRSLSSVPVPRSTFTFTQDIFTSIGKLLMYANKRTKEQAKLTEEL